MNNICVMVWGCISIHGVDNLFVFDESLNQHWSHEWKFAGASRANLYGPATPICVPVRQCSLSQSHVGVGMYGFQKRRKMLCPPQSPDVNPNGITWGWMKKDTWEVKPTTCKEIKAAIFRISDIIRPAKIRTVFSSLLRRAAAMIGSRSYPTKY